MKGTRFKQILIAADENSLVQRCRGIDDEIHAAFCNGAEWADNHETTCTRKEDIKKEAEKYYDIIPYGPYAVELIIAFVSGARWADCHPQDKT